MLPLLAAFLMLSPAFSICCPAFAAALSIALPARCAGPSGFWQADNASTKTVIVNIPIALLFRFLMFLHQWFGQRNAQPRSSERM
ncbi:hypothetical protein [Pandoraea sp.]|uniref:hypothetical protein n=1 Tax=Pandoraea sp. TaxID=1883445 RepID=UPI0025ED67B6|nr:hypothetical protein [Pandoraea sp.]